MRWSKWIDIKKRLGRETPPRFVLPPERWPLEHSDKFLVHVHPTTACAGEYCTVHNRSDHHMRGFRQHWRGDRGIMERICPHGIGHPDPDEINPDKVHGCDGCCADEPVVSPWGFCDG